jgi:hypothetical protein
MDPQSRRHSRRAKDVRPASLREISRLAGDEHDTVWYMVARPFGRTVVGGIFEVSALQVRTREVNAPKVRSFEVGTLEVRVVEDGTLEVHTLKVGNVLLGGGELRSREVGALQVRPYEAGAAEIGAAEVGYFVAFTRDPAVHVVELCTTEVRARELQVPEQRAAEIGVHQDRSESLTIGADHDLLAECAERGLHVWAALRQARDAGMAAGSPVVPELRRFRGCGPGGLQLSCDDR